MLQIIIKLFKVISEDLHYEIVNSILDEQNFNNSYSEWDIIFYFLNI